MKPWSLPFLALLSIAAAASNESTSKVSVISSILHLFSRPREPLCVPKGENGVTFELPTKYLPERFRNFAKRILARYFGHTKERVQLKSISIPDLSVPMQLGRREAFSTFIPLHRKLAAGLIDTFMKYKTYEDFLSAAVYSRDRLNPNLFIYALSVAILHRLDTKNLPIPSLPEIFPEKFMDSAVFSKAQEEANVVPAEDREPIEIPMNYTASDLDEEHHVAYFREDIGINLHHWHWHLVFPHDGPKSIVDKDRRGELFYYMHQQAMARYNAERLCNGMNRVRSFFDLREPIPEGYFPKLSSQVASRTYPARPSGAVLKDVNRPTQELKVAIQDLEGYRDRIYEAIRTGAVVNSEGESIPLTEKDGVDILGNLLESSSLSLNRKLYGDLHNMGHVIISLCHDPDNRYLESLAMMGETATAMRDPIFYAWHAFINDIFVEHKNTLSPYTNQQLEYPGIEIIGFEVQTPSQPTNVLSTFWSKSDVDLSRGLDFTAQGPMLARFTHLNHARFNYNIVVNNGLNSVKRGTVRIFLGPKRDERGLPFTLENQRGLMMEMVKFQVTLQPGENRLVRSSRQSSITIPFERTFRNLEQKNIPTNASEFEKFLLCGCGWPEHMLVPKGNKDGFPMELFVMVSDIQGDEVVQKETDGCNDAASFCGVRDGKYPDARPMGYPFDRRSRDGVNTLAQFLSGNMAVTDVNILFTDQVMPRTPSETTGNSSPSVQEN